MRKQNKLFQKRRCCIGAASMAHYLANAKSFQLAANNLLRNLLKGV